MYTQCDKCKAVFNVNMREVTIAKGKLRCGECNAVFNASKALSTTIPKSYQELTNSNNSKQIQPKEELKTKITKDKELPTEFVKPSFKINRDDLINNKNNTNWTAIVIILLFAFLVSQVFYNNRHVFLGTPQHEPEKIKMLSHNVFVHPTEPRVLLLSIQIENTAIKAQPYPILELSLKNSQSKLVAFRRFLPSEYLINYSEGKLIPSKRPINIKLKIKDPGSKATHFQFDFL